ncbi:unnamed protein product [Gongylonema pulchrum]|uniref:TIP120 domain-containing protein n=1 Tax=Gongylonema pulchrum TaxID=637853 RepID=A0A183E1C7_9BILA|nr:unnamed protein product [Gongylonema pulchrum]
MYQITSLLEKMASVDKDYRFMATNDLMVELRNDSIKLDDDSERKIVRTVVKLLEDKNSEVQNLAVKCLGRLVHKVKDAQAESVVDFLCDKMMAKDEKMRDVCSIALKTVISELPNANVPLTANVIKRVVPRLTEALKQTEPADVSVKLEVMDIVSDVLTRYGSFFAPYLATLQEALLLQLFSDRQAIRKRAIIALANLMVIADSTLYASTMDFIVGHLTAPKASVSQCRTMVQACQGICKATGSRFVDNLRRFVPVLFQLSTTTEDDELRESCIQTFESFIYRCPRDVTHFIPDIVKVVAEYLKLDPNYTYDDEDENTVLSKMDMDGLTLVRHFDYQLKAVVEKRADVCLRNERTSVLASAPLCSRIASDGGGSVSSHLINSKCSLVGLTLVRHFDYQLKAVVEKRADVSLRSEVEEDDEELNDYSDDDDVSWKVRRSCARCIEAIILSHRDEAVQYLISLGPLLISRFKEREDNVKWDIMHAYTALLSQIRNLIPNFSELSSVEKNGIGKSSAETVMLKGGVILRNAVTGQQLAALQIIVQALDSQIPLLVKAISKQFSSKVLRTRQSCFILLTQLLRTYPGSLSDELGHLMISVSAAMNDRSLDTNMKIDALTFLSTALCTHPPEMLHKHMNMLTPLVVRAVGEPFYKVAAEALTVTVSLIRVLRPCVFQSAKIDCSPYVNSIYDAEVKEKAITAAGLLISTFGDHLEEKLPICLSIFLDRLRNEMTRLVTVKALTAIVCSPLVISMENILSNTLLLLAEFLRKNQRALKVISLIASKARFV